MRKRKKIRMLQYICLLFLKSLCAGLAAAHTATLQAHHIIAVPETDVILPCEGLTSDSDTYLWIEETTFPDTRIFVVRETTEKTDIAKGLPKYDNFFVNNSYPKSADLIIRSFQTDDEGWYTCELVVGSVIVSVYTVQVEEKPKFVDLVCHEEPHCTELLEDKKSSQFYCTCDVVGVKSDAVYIQWNVGTVSSTTMASSFFGPTGTFDYRSQAIFLPYKEQNNISCVTSRSMNESNYNSTISVYKVAPPYCSLAVLPNLDCTSVILTCNCTEAIPNIKAYSFYDASKSLIGYSTDSNTLENVSLEKGSDATFFCRGCNGINYGHHSLAVLTFTCNRISTQIPTSYHTTWSDDEITTWYSSTSPGNGEKQRKSTWVIVGCCLGVVILIVMTAAYIKREQLLKFLCQRDSYSPQINPPDGGTQMTQTEDSKETEASTSKNENQTSDTNGNQSINLERKGSTEERTDEEQKSKSENTKHLDETADSKITELCTSENEIQRSDTNGNQLNGHERKGSSLGRNEEKQKSESENTKESGETADEFDIFKEEVSRHLGLDSTLRLATCFGVSEAVKSQIKQTAAHVSCGLKLLENLSERGIIKAHNVDNLHEAMYHVDLKNIITEVIDPYIKRIDPAKHKECKLPKYFKDGMLHTSDR